MHGGEIDNQDGPRGHRSRLRERFRNGGIEAFLPYEVLELLLTFAIPRRDVKGTAKSLVRRFDGVLGALRAREEDLRSVDGIGPEAALFIRFVGALSAYALREKACSRTVVSSPVEVADFLMLYLGFKREENFMVLFLNARNEILASEVLQVGTVDHAAVYPRQVIERALSHNACSLILVHNHPSGSPDPSTQDVALTRRIDAAARAVDMRVHDHMIVAAGRWVSLRESGMF